MNIYYVYAYLRKSDNTPYYIGKGKGNRAFKKHVGVSVPDDKSKIIILEKNLTEIGALALERRYIRWWGRKDIGTGILINRTEGGDGSSGCILSEETKRKMSLARKGNSNKSIATRLKISISLKGKPKSPEHTAKMIASQKGKKLSEETRAKMSAARTGKKRGPYKRS